MESDREQHEQALAEAERASVAPWIDYPPPPWWYEPAAGAWFAAMVLATAIWDRSLIYIAVICALVALESWFLGWYRRKWGTWPHVRSAPPEFHGPMRGYAVGVVIVFTAVGVTRVLAGPVAAAALAFVAVTAGLTWYERRFAVASRATRERVS